jgi:hypothetical protein
MDENRKVATTDLKLDEPGTLPRPGLVGRLARLALGALCLWYVYGLVMIGGDVMSPAGNVPTMIWNGILPGLFLVSYVVNIGYSRAWKKWPAIISALAFAAVALVGQVTSGTVETVALARLVWSWELYVFAHLGLSFLLAAMIGTPGCEMRAFHDLYSRVTGVPTKEHYCPVGPLHPIDQWEVGRTRD